MTATNKLGLELLQNAAANQALANTTFAQLNQVVQASVIDKDLATPPASPANEALYIVGPSATGAWAGKAGQLAYWLTTAGAWTFVVPKAGWQVAVLDELDANAQPIRYSYSGTAWGVSAGGAGGGMSNPMTAANDLILGGVSGAPTRLAAPSTAGFVLTFTASGVAWAAAAGGSFTGGKLTSELQFPDQLAVTAATTTLIGEANANHIQVDGVATISSFGVARSSGATKIIVFTDAGSILVNSATLALPTRADITVQAGDVLIASATANGADWRVRTYQRKDGKALIAPTKSEVGLGSVDNTSDANKPVSTAQQTALDAKAPINSPMFTGNIGVGVAAQANRKIRLGGTYTGTTEFRSIEFAESIDPSQAPSYQALTAGITLVDTTGTITANLFRTYPPGFNGANAVISELNNYYSGPVSSAYVTAAYSFRGLMGAVSGKTRFNIYCDGTAPNYVNGDMRIGTVTQNSSDKLTVSGSASVAAPLKLGQYTLTTLPSAATYSGYTIDVTNATGGIKQCRSNGTDWLIVNTANIVS